MEQENCVNCKHFKQHYVKRKSVFIEVACGHCIKQKANGRYRDTNKPCEYYQERSLGEERKENIKSAHTLLSVIAKRLDDLKEILNN